MVSPARRKRIAVILVLAAVACSDSPSGPSGPTTITNPAETISDLFAVSSVTNTPTFEAISVLNFYIAMPSAPLPLARLAAALQASLPPSATTALRDVLRRDGAPGKARLPANLLGGAGRPPVFPDSLLGLTFEWDPDSLHYASTSRSGAPLNGIRFILYETNTVTGFPDTAVEVGSLDVIDLAPAAGAQLQFLARGLNETPTYLDYALTFLPGPSAVTISADGFVSNGAAGSLERRFTFAADISSTATTGGTDQTVDFSYEYNVRNIAVDLHYALSLDTLQDSTVLAIDYRFTRPNENIRLLAADTTTGGGNIRNRRDVVTVNDHLYATLITTNSIDVLTDANGNVVPFNTNDDQYEDAILLALIVGVIFATGTLAAVLAIPAYLVGFTFGAL